MNNGPVPVLAASDGEGSVEVVRHYGVALPPFNVKGQPFAIRWDVPYDEAEARADLAQNPGAKLVTRTETKVTVLTPWKEVAE